MNLTKYKMMYYTLFTFFFLAIHSCGEKEMPIAPPPPQVETVDVDFYLTTSDQTNLISLQNNSVFAMSENNNFTINVSENDTYQTMEGFGYTLTGGSAMLINSMSASSRNSLLQDLFSVTNGNAVSYLRISIGASDLDANVFSYNDLPAGQTDINLDNFSIAPDRTHLIPVLKEILAINPNIKILGSPWSAPVWMKTNGNTVGGKLQQQYYATYAKYFVKYIKAMQAEGITINAMTIQNEPENPYNNPSMLMEANEQRDFIANHLGPLFASENITTDIILFDHNLDNPNYPISIMNDPTAKQYVAGSAFHLYAGSIDQMSLVHNAHPDKGLYFTEQWIEAPGNFSSDTRWHFRELIIGASRNWSKVVLQWNLAADPQSGPHTDGGCTKCLGAITIDGNTISRNPAYYIIAQVSKFVPPGSVRIGSNNSSDIQNVAFKTPDDKIVVIVLNNSDTQKSFNVNVEKDPISMELPAGSIATLIW